MRIRFRLLALLTAAALAGCVTASPPGPGDIVDDKSLQRGIEDQATALHKAGNLPLLSSLMEAVPPPSAIRFPETRPSTRALSPAELYRVCRDSVVVLCAVRQCGNCDRWHDRSTAGGFLISASGMVVTNHHVVDEPEKTALVAMTADGRLHAVERVLAVNPVQDVAVLKLAGDGFAPLPLASGPAPAGTPLTLISHPSGRFYTLTTGTAGRHYIERKRGHVWPMMAVTTEYAVGSSGCPLLDPWGRVAGMVATTSPFMAGEGSQDRYAQMVWRACVPALVIRQTLRGEQPPAQKSPEPDCKDTGRNYLPD
jgi:S1-C subfamily serine protease